MILDMLNIFFNDYGTRKTVFSHRIHFLAYFTLKKILVKLPN